MGKEILIFSSREICYFSSNFFANEMGTAFEELGDHVSVCEIAKEDDLDLKLNPYVNREFDLILDFNSLLPRMEMDDGSLLINHLHGPFYDWAVDHPLFHHVALSAGINKSNAILLDETQTEYVKTYYPEVKNAFTLPLSGSESFVPVEKSQDMRVLFTGTYDTPENIGKLIDKEAPELAACMWKLVEMRIADPELPMEDAYLLYLQEKGIERNIFEFRDDMNRMYAVDVYVRDYFRKKAIDTLLDARIPMRVIGHGWNKYEHRNKDCMLLEKPVFFNLSFEKIAREHILLNVAPIFHHGVHDRVFAGMANHTAVLTEQNPYVKQNFLDEKELCMYSLLDENSLKDRAEELMTNRAKREAMAEAAYQCYRKKHTWKKRAEYITMQIDK